MHLVEEGRRQVDVVSLAGLFVMKVCVRAREFGRK